MNPIQIEKLQKELSKSNTALQLEKKKNQEFKSKNKTLKEEIRQLNKKINTLEGKLSRSKEQEERSKQILQEELKKNHSNIMVPQQRIARHQYTDLIVQICVEMYMKAHISFKSVTTILSLLNNLMAWDLKRIPCANTVENWVKKSGYVIYHNAHYSAPKKAHAVKTSSEGDAERTSTCCPAPEKEYAVVQTSSEGDAGRASTCCPAPEKEYAVQTSSEGDAGRTSTCCPAPEKEYAIIADESMMLGSEKMILVLGVDANKVNNKALTQNDINILDIAVDSSWNSAGIEEELKKTEKKVGYAPLYAIGDNDVKLSKAFRDKGYTHIRDVGHTMALQVQYVYKEGKDFKGLIKETSASKVSEVMRPTGYLSSPCQRSIARFMNLSVVIAWAANMLQIFPTLNEEEQKTFKFVQTYRPLIEELGCVFKTVNTLLKDIKNNGLSYKHIDRYIQHLNECLNSKCQRVRQVGENLSRYLLEELCKLPDTETCWNASSDIIESTFSKYKFRRSKNPLNGVTSYVLLLPLLTKMGEKDKPSQVNFKASLEKVVMKDLTDWTKDNLTENLAVKRRRKLAG
jgi:hypothetical protein